MKRFLALVLFVSTAAHAAPFLVSDPAPANSQIDKCVYQDGTAAAVETPLTTYTGYSGPGCKIDLAAWTAGTHNLQVWYRSSLWGVDSAKTPFTLTKPAAGGTGPSNLQVQP
jgi:hypothetical protein